MGNKKDEHWEKVSALVEEYIALGDDDFMDHYLAIQIAAAVKFNGQSKKAAAAKAEKHLFYFCQDNFLKLFRDEEDSGVQRRRARVYTALQAAETSDTLKTVLVRR